MRPAVHAGGTPGPPLPPVLLLPGDVEEGPGAALGDHDVCGPCSVNRPINASANCGILWRTRRLASSESTPTSFQTTPQRAPHRRKPEPTTQSQRRRARLDRVVPRSGQVDAGR